MAIFIQVTNDVNNRLYRCRVYVAKKYRLHLRDDELISILLENFWRVEKVKCEEKEKRVEGYELF